jgi:hypothetical protein
LWPSLCHRFLYGLPASSVPFLIYLPHSAARGIFVPCLLKNTWWLPIASMGHFRASMAHILPGAPPPSFSCDSVLMLFPLLKTSPRLLSYRGRTIFFRGLQRPPD